MKLIFLNKYNLNHIEVNKKIILVNEDTRKLLSDLILDNTIYNIVSEAVYGVCDLTEKQKLFFFKNKNIITSKQFFNLIII